jgi:hypothetical protein
MGGYFPGPAGVAAFAAIKFAGYAAGAWVLKKVEPAVTMNELKIAGLRTGLGILLGIPASVVGVMLVSSLVPKAGDVELYPVLAIVRIGIWALLLLSLVKRGEMSAGRLWLYALLGSALSCLLDLPAFKLMMVAPGQIPVC